MEEKTCFQSDVHLDLETYKAFQKANWENHRRSSIMGLLYIVCVLIVLSLLDSTFTAKISLALSVFSIGTWLFQWHRSRDGGIGYKRILRESNGLIPHNLITVDEGGITHRNLSTGKEMAVDFTSVQEILESKQLLILVDDLRIGHIIDKSTLTGGSRDALVSFLCKSCPKMKKRVKTGRLGRLIRYLMYSLAIISLVTSLAVLLYIPQTIAALMTVSGTPTKHFVEVSYRELAQELETAGIMISEDVLDNVGSVPAYCPSDTPKSDNYWDLLCWEGQGNYEKNVFYQEGSVEAYDWNWTPSTAGIYWFDTEVSNFGSIYTDFLRGIAAMDETLIFTNVNEDYSQASIPAGQGTITFSFDYNEESYTFEAEYNNDWFDTDMLFAVGRILAADGDPKDLWFTFDQGQGLLLYYGTAEEVRVLEKITNIDFLDTETMWIGH